MMKKLSGINPAALGALLKGDMENFVAASTPGGIEAQERRGQIEQSFQETLPQEMIGCTQVDFEKMGFKFTGKVVDKIFLECAFPDGWRKQPTEHSMWSNLLDNQGRRRASIFFKAAFYDYNANISLDRRYAVRNASFDYKKSRRFTLSGRFQDGMEKTEEAYSQYEVIDTAPSSILFSAAMLPVKDWSNREEAVKIYEQEKVERQKCTDWLAKKFPDYENPLAYWD